MPGKAAKHKTDKKKARAEKPITPYRLAFLASRSLLMDLNKKITTNEPRIIEKKDAEALHDYRIAVRKVRSLLAQLDGVLPEPGLSDFREGFAEIMDMTCLLRDLEVCNEMLSKIDSVIPSVRQEQIGSVLDYMKTREKQERDRLALYLTSAAHQKFMEDWSDYLDKIRNPSEKLERADSPIRLVASEAISLRYMKTVKQARKTARRSSIEEFHNMRKSGKKLRYLIELFSDLYPDKAVKSMQKELKKFQNTLGKMQDLEVQSRLLSRIVTEMSDSLDTENRASIEKIIRKKDKRKQKMQIRALKLIKVFPESARKKIDNLITV